MPGISQPMFRVYAAVPGQDGREKLLDIGLAQFHGDYKGLNISLQALPLGGKLVLREVGDQQSLLFRCDEFDSATGKPLSLRQRMDAYESAVIKQCLCDAGGRVSTVMKWLGIPRRTLSDKIARFGIDRKACLDRTSRTTGSDGYQNAFGDLRTIAGLGCTSPATNTAPLNTCVRTQGNRA